MFIKYSNSFMSTPNPEDNIDKAYENSFKMSIENLEAFTIFPKEVIDGRTLITA